jgi:hypothetical protein
MGITKTFTFIVIIGSLLMFGCNSISNAIDNNNGAYSDPGIIGTWSMTQMTFEVGTATYTVMASDSQQLSLTLNSNLTYYQRQISIASGVNVTTEENGSYSISGSNLNQVSKAGIQTNGKYSISGTEMILTSTKISQGQTYTTVYHFRRK